MDFLRIYNYHDTIPEKGIEGENRMNKTFVKTLSAALAVSMVLSVAACQKKNNSSGREKSRSGQKINAGTPWFDANDIQVEPFYDKSRKLEYISQRLAGADDKYLVLYSSGYYQMPNDNNINWETFDYNQYMISSLSVLDRETHETVNTVDLSGDIPKNGYIDNIIYANGVATVMVSVYDEKFYEMKSLEIEVDPETGKVLSSNDVEREVENGGSVEKSFTFGDYTIATAMAWDEDDNGYYLLYVTDSEGNKETLEIQDPKFNIWDIPVLLPLDATTILIPASTDEEMVYYTLDLNTLAVNEADMKEYEWLDIESISSSTIGDDGMVYYSSNTGINRLDMKKKSTEEVFNYSWCSVRRNDISNLQIVEASEDKFLLCGEIWNYSPYQNNSSDEFKIIEFTRADKNPHAGKTILELYTSYGYSDVQVSDAIIKFNDTNPDYFIEVSDRYTDSVEYEYNSDSDNPDDYEKTDLNYNASMSNVLAMDIMNGEGPDILLDVSQYGQLNNPNYLADLTPYIGSLSSDKYFTNVIDAAKNDGALYQLPLTYSIVGIQTDAKYAGKSGVGFTTEEYEKFLKDSLNGKDVINSGQAVYFEKLFSAMSDKFIVNGKADFKCEDFRTLAEFVKENVPERAKSWDEYYGEDDGFYAVTDYAVGAAIAKGDRYGMDPEVATYNYCYGIGSFLMAQSEVVNGNAILGIASTDGRGPSLSPASSVAISAQAENVDACGEFVKILMSEDIQKEFAMQDYFVLSRDAFRDAAEYAIEFYNGEGSYYFTTYDPQTGESKDNSRKFTSKDIDDAEKIITSCSRMDSVDASINLILLEEMPAFFTGQKDLDSVIAIAQDRVQKVLDERG